MTKKMLVWVAMISFMTVLAACNTIEGVGKDVSSGGDHVEDAAKDVKKGM